jgi:nicotinamidase-related amidase
MTTLENRPNTVRRRRAERRRRGAHERDAVVAHVGSLVEKARREGVPVVYGDSFEDTTLEIVLSGLGVTQTDACIRSTLHGAFARGYDATLVSDAHTTEDQTAWGAPAPDQVIAHTNLYGRDEGCRLRRLVLNPVRRGREPDGEYS